MKTLLVVSVLAAVLIRASAATGPRLDSIDLGQTRLVIVKIPAGTFQMGTDEDLGSRIWGPIFSVFILLRKRSLDESGYDVSSSLKIEKI
jgi:hypothetical protein